MNTEQENLIAQFVVRQVFNHPELSTPEYCQNVLSEHDVDRLSGSLPLICIWDENWFGESFKLAVNGALLAKLLAPLVACGDPSFRRIQSKAMLEICQEFTRAVAEACRESGTKPSEHFAPNKTTFGVDQIELNAA